MKRRANLAAPGLLLAVAALLLALTLSGVGGGRGASASMPYRAVAPQLVADNASGVDADPNGPHTPTPYGSSTPTATPTTAANACGGGHAQLLTFTDDGAASVDRDATASTLGFLRTQPRPDPVPSSATRVAPVETALYTFQVVLDRVSLLPNGTMLLIVEDPDTPGAEMRVDLPAPSCFAKASVADQGMLNSARTNLRLACGDPPASGSRDLAGTATITGPGYWGSTALADSTPNGVEIGPLLGFTFTAESCDPNHQPTPTPTPNQTLDSITVGVDLIAIYPGHP